MTWTSLIWCAPLHAFLVQGAIVLFIIKILQKMKMIKITTISYLTIDKLYYYNFCMPNSNKKIQKTKTIVVPSMTIDNLY
jgi:hypothetical protein